jgi:hypothetical protein
MPAKRRDALEAEFKRLAAQNDGFVPLEAFLGMDEVAELLEEKLLAKAEVRCSSECLLLLPFPPTTR